MIHHIRYLQSTFLIYLLQKIVVMSHKRRMALSVCWCKGCRAQFPSCITHSLCGSPQYHTSHGRLA